MTITYHDLYLKIRMALSGAGIEGAQLEAREILCAAAGKTAEELYRDISLYTTEDIAEKAVALQERRLTGEPIAYLVGEWSFCGLPFYVSREALIPRVDTEMLAQLAMNRLKEYPGNTRILDLCAGTGCVGLTAAALIRNTRAVLVDLSDGALDLCKRNIRRHKLTGRAVYLKGDALQPPSHALGQFDVLVCNPPYIPTGDLAGLDSSVKDFEPLMALDGGADGLDFYRQITTLWQPALKPGGHLLYEVGIGQAEQVAWLLVKAGYENIRITRDTGGIDRVVEGQRPQEPAVPETPKQTEEEEG
ncbi:MAG TPA: peptide chain release factor N(5)-glutamine methyltransferase [Candidatus Evtepia faecigallinarum]|nr:peptide chain release factor N(5)-glutamine methyltransferase [Candidatus Evtepia faecigallinarum]